MEHRFQWDRERIRFFCDAAQNSAYHQTLATLVAQELDRDDSVLDAGCGLGFLSEALLPFCCRVTAVDCDPNAIAALVHRIGRNERLQALCADVRTVSEPFDTVVCCYFGSTDEALRLSERTHAKKLILIKRQRAEHRFGTDLPEHERTAKNTARLLDAQGFAYRCAETAITFDQPLRTISDAAAFLSLYRKTPIAEKDAVRLCKKTDDPVFPYRLPATNELCMFTVLL